MGFHMMMIWTTTYDKATGKPHATNPPDVPSEYREFLSRNGWFWANFILHDGDDTHMSADAMLENYAVEWNDVDWENMPHEAELREDYKKEYEQWRTALKWFATHGFDAIWWW
jgi:hypothetical protein